MLKKSKAKAPVKSKATTEEPVPMPLSVSELPEIPKGIGINVPFDTPNLDAYQKRHTRIKWARKEREACLSVLAGLVKEGAILEDGRIVSTAYDAIRWVFGEIADKKSELPP